MAKSIMNLRFLVWTAGWVVVLHSEAGNIEQEASPLPHSSPPSSLKSHVDPQPVLKRMLFNFVLLRERRRSGLSLFPALAYIRYSLQWKGC